MGLTSDFFSLIVNAWQIFAKNSPLFYKALIGGIFLGAVCWVICSYYTRLWNLRYRITLTHHILCGIAALFTLLFTLFFVSLKYTEQATQVVIADWQGRILRDSAWKQNTHRKAYFEVKALSLEDFTRYQNPDQAFPIAYEKSKRTLANVYATESVGHFKRIHPFLSTIMQAKSHTLLQRLNDDVAQFFKSNPSGTYDETSSVGIAGKQIKLSLDAQVNRVVFTARSLLVLLFILVQAVPFGLIGLAAYRDLKVTT